MVGHGYERQPDDETDHAVDERRDDPCHRALSERDGVGDRVGHGVDPVGRRRPADDASGRPTYTAAGTSDTPAIVIQQDDGRFAVQEVSL